MGKRKEVTRKANGTACTIDYLMVLGMRSMSNKTLVTPFYECGAVSSLRNDEASIQPSDHTGFKEVHIYLPNTLFPV